MESRTRKRVCYDREYIRQIDCPCRAQHAASIASLGSIGVVPGAGFVHACSCVANGFERSMVRSFRDGLGAGNHFFLEEMKARLSRYMLSQHIGAGVCLYVAGHGLVIYYNWAYSQRAMFGYVRNGEFVAPSDGKEVSPEFPPYRSYNVFPLAYGISGTTTTVGGLMGSTRELHGIVRDREQEIRKGPRNGRRHICDVTMFVLHRDAPILGSHLPCGCAATQKHVDSLRRYFSERDKEVMSGAELDLDLTTLVRALRRTGAALHWEPGMGVLCLLSREVIGLDVEIIFERDAFVLRGAPQSTPATPTEAPLRLDSRIQKSYVSALPTCRYLQYH